MCSIIAVLLGLVLFAVGLLIVLALFGPSDNSCPRCGDKYVVLTSDPAPSRLMEFRCMICGYIWRAES